MNEFKNRMKSQREIIQTLNSKNFEYQICGLSRLSIEKWIRENKIDPSSKMVLIIYRIANKLFFLATKSQDQISRKYRELSESVLKAKNELIEEMEKNKY